MEILFTTNDRLLSRIIRKITNGPCSHVAVLIDPNIVVHSTATHNGIAPTFLETFMRNNEIISRIPVPESRELLQRLRDAEGNGYDFLLLLTMGLRKLGLPVPEVNNPYLDLCTEVVTQYVLGTDKKYTPEQLRQILLSRSGELNNG